MLDVKDIIAKRVAKEFKSGDFINLGIGIPAHAANFLDPDVKMILHSENGFLNLGEKPRTDSEFDPDLTNAGAQPVTILKGGVFFDLQVSFGIMRGGHLDATVLGALQVSSKGDIANWIIPGKFTPGMGGAMDLVVGSKNVIVAMEHTSKGEPKIFDECTLPLTAVGVVNMIFTELAVFVIKDKLMTLSEVREGVSLEDIKKVTPATYTVSANLKTF